MERTPFSINASRIGSMQRIYSIRGIETLTCTIFCTADGRRCYRATHPRHASRRTLSLTSFYRNVCSFHEPVSTCTDDLCRSAPGFQGGGAALVGSCACFQSRVRLLGDFPGDADAAGGVADAGSGVAPFVGFCFLDVGPAAGALRTSAFGRPLFPALGCAGRLKLSPPAGGLCRSRARKRNQSKGLTRALLMAVKFRQLASASGCTCVSSTP